jgi:glutathione S-transferase
MGGLGPMQGQTNVFYRYFPTKIPEVIERYQNETRRLYGVMDRQLTDHDYIAGDYSIADMACFPWVDQHEWSGIDLSAYPHLSRWHATIGNRRAVQRGMQIPSPARKPEDVVAAAQKMLVGAPDARS